MISNDFNCALLDIMVMCKKKFEINVIKDANLDMVLIGKIEFNEINN